MVDENGVESKHDEFLVQEHFLFSYVCSSVSQEEVVKRMAQRPCGTKGGWQLDDDEDAPNPVACSDNPKTHKHWRFAA